MAYFGTRQQKMYDRLQIPNLNADKRRSPQPDHFDLSRRTEGGRARTQTLQYSFDFSRAPGSRQRLSASPDIVSVTSQTRPDSRTSGPAGAPGGRQNTKGARKSDGTRPRGSAAPGVRTAPQHARSQSAAQPRQHAGAPRQKTRPASGSVTDFRTVAPKNRQKAPGSGINAPRLTDTGTPGAARGRAPSSRAESSQRTGAARKPGAAPGHGAFTQSAEGARQPRTKGSMTMGTGYVSSGTSHSGSAKRQGPHQGTGSAGTPGRPSAGPDQRKPRQGQQKPPQIPHSRNHQQTAPPKKPKKPQLNPARGAGDQSARTVVGFDISRSVFSKNAQPAPVPKTTDTRVQWNAGRVRNATFAVFALLCIFAMLVFSLTHMAQVSEITRQNSELERGNEELSEQISKAEMQIALEEDLSNVKERAESLGLRLPDESQIEYVDLDAGETAGAGAAEAAEESAAGGNPDAP